MDKPPGLLAVVLDMIRMVLYHINASYLIASESFNNPINGLLQIIACRMAQGKDFYNAQDSIINFVYLISFQIYQKPCLDSLFVFPSAFLPFDILLQQLQDEFLMDNQYIRMGLKVCALVDSETIVRYIVEKTQFAEVIAGKMAFYWQKMSSNDTRYVEQFNKYMNFLDGIFEHCSWRNLTEQLVTTISSNFFEPLLSPRLMTHDASAKIETLRNIANMLRGVKTIRFKQEFAKFLLKGKTNEKDSLWSGILMNVSSENKQLSAVTLEVIYLMVSTGNWEICGLLFSPP